jgi:fumarate reductase subunit D
MAHKKTIEPFLWSIFSAGGVLAALLIPIQLLLFGMAFARGWLPWPKYEHLQSLLHNPLTRIYLFVLCAFALFHAAHRFRFTLYDGLQIKHLNEIINTLCYGGALAGTLTAAYLLFLWQVF